jgi:hypothetical protein
MVEESVEPADEPKEPRKKRPRVVTGYEPSTPAGTRPAPEAAAPEVPAPPAVEPPAAAAPGESASTSVPAQRKSLEERLATASNSALRTRRERIDQRLFEIAHPIGEALTIMGAQLHGTKIVDLDRILKKIDRIENDIADAERGTGERPEGFLKAISADLGRISERFAARDLHDKRSRLVAELGLALLASDLRALRERAPDVAVFAGKHADEARAVDDLFKQARLVDDELAERGRDGRLHKEPKAIDRFVARTGEVVGDATEVAKDKIVDLGKRAGKAAVRGSGKAVWGLTKKAFQFGKDKIVGDDGDDDDLDDAPRKKRRPAAEARAAERESARPATELLRELAKLHKDGILTDEEFARKKAELLKRI